MTETTDIEKKSLEAHVELCAERYKALERQFDSVREDIADIKDCVQTVNQHLGELTDRRNTQLISWGSGIIVCLIGLIGYLLTSYVLPPLP